MFARASARAFDGALSERGSVRVAGHDGADDVGEQGAGSALGGGDGWIGLGGNELRVARGQLLEAALAPGFASVGGS